MNPLGFVLPAASIGFGALLIKPRRGFFPAAPQGPVRPLIAQATIEERHNDEIEITEHPVEQGASIADHAFKRPAEVVIRCGWSNSPSTPNGSLISQAVGLGAALVGNPLGALASIPSTAKAAQSLLKGNDQGQIKQIYQQLLQLQESRVPFDLFTGKRSYSNMLLKSLSCETDEKSENILLITASCRQVIIVVTTVVAIGGSPETQSAPEKTAPVEPQGAKQLLPAESMSPDLGSMSGAMDSLSAGLDQAQALLGSAPDVLSQMSGPLSQLPDVMSQVQGSVGSLLEQLPKPFDIPFISGAQSFSLSLPEGIDLKSALGQAIEAMPSTLSEAREAITAAQKQLPSVASLLPSSLSALPAQLVAVQGQIQGAAAQVTRVLSR